MRVDKWQYLACGMDLATRQETGIAVVVHFANKVCSYENPGSSYSLVTGYCRHLRALQL
jgi:hypothetical protein